MGWGVARGAWCVVRDHVARATIQPAVHAVSKTLHGVDHAVEHFELLIEAGDFQDLAIDAVGRGNFQVAAVRRGACLGRRAAPSARCCRAFRRRRDRARSRVCARPAAEAEQRRRLIFAHFIRRMHDGHVAEDFSGKVHGWWHVRVLVSGRVEFNWRQITDCDATIAGSPSGRGSARRCATVLAG